MAADIAWKDWRKVNINRSWRDVRKLVQYAESGNPQQAIADERAHKREHYAKAIRSQKNDLGPGRVAADEALASENAPRPQN